MNSSINTLRMLLAATAILASAQPHAAGPQLALWRNHSGVTWAAPAPTNQADEHSVQAPIAGVHMDGRGRVFVSTPRLVSAKAPATLSILDTRFRDGPARLRAFPSVKGNAVSGAPETHLRNVLGFHVDTRNDWLWALDMGFVAGESEAPVGGQKLVVYDLKQGDVVKVVALDGVADRHGSFLNDITVDERRRIAYISDSGLRSAPANQAGIIVVDLNSSRAQRVLHRHASVMPEPGASVTSHGETVWPGNPLVLGINGIALSPDARSLYWTVTTGTKVFSVPTDVLSSPGVSDAEREAKVREVGDVGGNTDGIVFGRDGHLYVTDVSRNGIVRLDVRTGEARLVASSEKVFWPDTATVDPKGRIVFTASHLNAHFAGNVKAGDERYQFWRITP